MTDLVDPLSGRVMSAFALSVGTSLAFESIFTTSAPSIDPTRVIPQKVEIGAYDEFWINLSTITRNIFSALDQTFEYQVGPQALSEAILFEMEMIQSIMNNEGNNQSRIVFYACEYKEATSQLKHPKALLRLDNTLKQKSYTQLHNKALDIVLKQFTKTDGVLLFDSRLKPLTKNKVLVLTHVPYDLFSANNFRTLDLIESHTGVLKKKHLWYTKYYNGNDLPMIPFNEGFIQIFGDHLHFRPLNIKMRHEIIKIATHYNWSSITTHDKIIYGINTMKDHYMREIVKLILK